MTAAQPPDPQQGTRERLIRAMLDALRTRGFHGVGISEAGIAELLAIDLELNAHGMAVWLDRPARG